MQLKDKVVVVTGGARGIGKAIAGAFADKGAKLAVLDLNPRDLDGARDEFASRGIEIRTFAANVAKEDQLIAALDGVVSEYGRLDVIVNNAGIPRMRCSLVGRAGRQDGAGPVAGRHRREPDWRVPVRTRGGRAHDHARPAARSSASPAFRGMATQDNRTTRRPRPV
jgi:NAD(P)-dependent dehydrogenase (short-subunit alcohol dehydrogenase family)